MAMGSYNIGATVRIPLIILDEGVAFTENVNPTIKQIIKPNNTSATGFPKSMLTANDDYATYYLDYKPDLVGDYIVIICYTYGATEFSVIENFTVNREVSSSSIPRAEAR